jgi:tetratricopeptide (TPR) repeat protein
MRRTMMTDRHRPDTANTASVASIADAADRDTSTVRIPLWSGVQPIAALWFAAELHTPDARVQRMLTHWRTGAKALRFADGDLLRFPEPQLGVCEVQPGLALCFDPRITTHGALTSAPLRAKDLDTIDDRMAETASVVIAGASAARTCDLLLVHGARVLGLRQTDGATLDLSQWIDIDAYALHDTFDCNAAVPVPDARRLAGRGVRDLLGEKIPPPSAEREAFLERLSERARDGRAAERMADIGVGGGRHGSGRAGGGDASGGRLRAIGQDWLGRIAAGLLGGLAAAGTAAGSASGRGKAGANDAGGIHARQGPVAPSRWREALTRLAIASRMSRLIGWRHGAYLRKMLQMFEDGDLHEALRHALPIDATGPSRGQAFSAPGRRNELSLSGASDVSTDIGLPDELRDHLRTLYRQSFERLDRAGKIDEALFVLAELLNAKQEALDYLERHGRHAQAAELALAWDMPASTIVRLLLLAGDWERAVQVARRDGDFAAAVAALENTKPELAIKLRLAWGEALAERGEWLTAMETVWPIAQARNLALHWLQAAEAAGERLSARALVRRAEHLPDTLERYGERLLALADPDTDADARFAVAQALLEAKTHNAATRAIAAAIAPALLADRAERRHDMSKAHLRKVLHLSDDPWLSVDAPELSVPAVKAKAQFWNGANALRWEAPAVGLRAVHDVAMLDDHRYLVALGEAGAAVIDRRGKTVRSYAVPAYALAIGHSRNIALATAPRETLSRVTRLDLVHHTATDLGAIPIAFCADMFEGIGWSVVSRNRILVIDTAKSLHDVLWHVGDLPGPVVSARYASGHEMYLIRSGNAFELWNYNLSGRRLTSRERIELQEGTLPLLYPHGHVLQLRVTEKTEHSFEIGYDWHRQARRVRLGIPEGEIAPRIVCQALTQGFLLGVVGERSARYGLYRSWDARCMAEFDWPASAALRIRELPDALLIFDEEGRVLALDSDGTVRDTISVR